jgi:hypothetical protein
VGSKKFLIHGIPSSGSDEYSVVSFGAGIGFSQIGWEIFDLANVEPHPEYLKLIRRQLSVAGLDIVEQA